MEKSELLAKIEGNKALAHLMIGSLSFISANSFDINLLLKDGSTVPYQFRIADLLRDLKHFSINSHDKTSQYKFPLDTVAKLLDGSTPEKDELIQLYFNMCLEVPFKRSFELLKTYCNKTGQFDIFKNVDWYPVARAIRNCFSHDFILNVREKNQLPYIWEDITITEDMLDKPISRRKLSIDSQTKLFDTMNNFALSLD